MSATLPTTKEANLKSVIAYLEKKYGKGTIMKLGEKQKAAGAVFSSGSLGLNLALGIGGFPCGRIIEIYGPASSGKTTLAMHAMAEVQRQGGKALLIDTEHAFDKKYAEALGINVQELLICQPDYGEQALDVAEHCLKSEAIELIVIDSVSALIPEAELKGEMGEHNIGGQARLMSQAMRKLTAIIHKTGAVCLFINQLRHKIGIAYGSPETTSGGNALKFYASVRLDIRSIKWLTDEENNKTGQRTRVKVVKNKLSAPFREAEFDILYGRGVSQTGEIVDISVSLGILKKSGSWFYYNKERLGQGRTSVINKLLAEPDLQQTLLKVMQKEQVPQ